MQIKTGIINYHETIDTFLKNLKEGSKILDIGSGNRKISFKDKTMFSFDQINYKLVEVVGNAEALPFRDTVFDAILLQQVLEHVRSPIQILEEANRVLKKNGRIYIEVPFIYPIHDKDDYWRWSKKGLELMSTKIFIKEDSGVVMGTGNALSLINSESLNVLFSFGHERLYNFFRIILRLFTFWLKYVDVLIKENAYTENIAPAVYFIGKKNE
jgi:SAM-dependent methyltransferase